MQISDWRNHTDYSVLVFQYFTRRMFIWQFFLDWRLCPIFLISYWCAPGHHRGILGWKNRYSPAPHRTRWNCIVTRQRMAYPRLNIPYLSQAWYKTQPFRHQGFSDSLSWSVFCAAPIFLYRNQKKHILTRSVKILWLWGCFRFQSPKDDFYRHKFS